MVFPCATGDENYIGGAVETVEAIRLIKADIPNVRTVLGISLTVARVDEQSFDVSLIPETLERTTLGAAAAGTRVNLEVDVVAKYVEKLLPR